jgi:DNA polymerase (family 10)
VRLYDGLEVRLHLTEPRDWGATMVRHTGSRAHLARLRAELRGDTEEAVYAGLALPFIAAELREDTGEIEAARNGSLPKLIELADLKGDLHCHTNETDGVATLEEMALAAREWGYEYLAITDHSASMGFGSDVSPERLRAQIALIRSTDIDGIQLLAGSEVNILPDGSLDYDDELLEQLDWVIASVHSSFRMSSERMTKRIIRAVEHPLVDAIGHPSGRKLEQRAPYEFDLGRVIDAAAAAGTMLEINSNPDRRDLTDTAARAAASAGIPIVINSDAHRPKGFAVARYGIATARRAWLTAKDVANTRSWDELAALRPRNR